MTTRLSDSGFGDRTQTIRSRLAETDTAGGVWFGTMSIKSLTGFHHVQTERPVNARGARRHCPRGGDRRLPDHTR